MNPSTHRSVWRLAGPMILANLSTPLLGAVDTAVMGHLSDARYLAAVALGATMIHLLFWSFGFLRMGTTGLAAQACGHGDGSEMREVLGRTLLLAAGLGVILVILQVPARWLTFTLVGADTAITHEAVRYFDIRIWGAPAALSTYAIVGWLLGMQNARGPLVIMLVANTANILLDILLVVGLGLRTDGVAWASLAADILGLATALWLARRQLRAHPGTFAWSTLLDGAALRRLLHINGDIFVRTLALLFAFTFFTAQGARLGTTVLAVNAVLLNFQTFMAYGLDGFAHAAEALVGKAIGSGDRERLRTCIRITGQWSVVVALLFSLTFAAFGGQIIRLLTSIPDVATAAADYLPWLIITPVVSCWAFWLDGVFIGATRSTVMRNSMLLAVLLIYLPGWYLLTPFGNHGLWAALILFLAARGITLGWALRQARWL